MKSIVYQAQSTINGRALIDKSEARQWRGNPVEKTKRIDCCIGYLYSFNHASSLSNHAPCYVLKYHLARWVFLSFHSSQCLYDSNLCQPLDIRPSISILSILRILPKCLHSLVAVNCLLSLEFLVCCCRRTNRSRAVMWSRKVRKSGDTTNHQWFVVIRFDRYDELSIFGYHLEALYKIYKLLDRLAVARCVDFGRNISFGSVLKGRRKNSKIMQDIRQIDSVRTSVCRSSLVSDRIPSASHRCDS